MTMKLPEFAFACILLFCFADFGASSSQAQPPWGGGDRGGGDRGGRGGFDPSSFLERMDRNGNGVLDPDEQEGGASFMIRRMASMDSSIKEGQPIPMSKIKEGFEKMRSSRGGDDRGRGRGRGDDDDDDDRRRGRGRGRDDDDNDRDRRGDEREDLQTELLVPGFGNDSLPPLVMGFGPSAELMVSEYSEKDLAEGNERVRQFDKNKNGFIDQDEISSRFLGNPLDFDINRDGRLSAVEMAVRQGRRREASEDRDRRNNRPEKGTPTVAEVEDFFNGRNSYRSTAGRRDPTGVPSFFTEKDANQDGVVTMPEYADDWTDELVEQFADYDFDGDGRITAAEALRSVEQGTVSEIMGRRGSNTAVAPSSTPENVGQIDPKYRAYAGRILKRADTNGDGILVPSEMAGMLMNPIAADSNGDGRVSWDEYAWYLQEKDKK